ncbi:MAG: hypothetical protein JW829_17800 [Pirellulales bacterium]|nr:hypothetical protein [Pirellulales bacterium]
MFARSYSVRWLGLMLGSLCWLSASNALTAADGTLDLPLPPTATNAALHYQRGILFLGTVDVAKRELLDKSIWEILGTMSKEDQLKKINDLLFESRHAIRSALFGAQQGQADFGTDSLQYSVATLIPHADPMVRLHKLVLLYGMQLQSEGHWEDAAEVYLKAFRMAGHLTHQLTLAEAMAGVEMLEANYYVFSMWAVRCPEQTLVNQASRMMNVLAKQTLNPATTMSHEFRILKLQLATFRASFPDGPWAEMVLEKLNMAIPPVSDQELRQAAIAAAAERGLSADIFKDKQSFDRYVDQLKSIYLSLAEETAAAFTLPTVAAVEQGQAIHAKYASRLGKFGDTGIVNPGQIAAYFATHDAELTLTKVIVALAAIKGEQGYPKRLEVLKDRFGGQVPSSPYDGSPLSYEVLEDGRGFHITVPKVDVDAIELPSIDFRFLPAEEDQ